MVRVLPLPAPANTSSGPFKCATACFWGSYSSGISTHRLHRAGAGASPALGNQGNASRARVAAGRNGPPHRGGAGPGARLVGDGGAAAALAVAHGTGAGRHQRVAGAAPERAAGAALVPAGRALRAS